MKGLKVESNVKICMMILRNSPATKFIDVTIAFEGFKVIMVFVQILDMPFTFCVTLKESYLTSLNLDFFIRKPHHVSHIGWPED